MASLNSEKNNPSSLAGEGKGEGEISKEHARNERNQAKNSKCH